MRKKLAVQFLGFYKAKSGREMALYHATKGDSSAVELFKKSQGEYFKLSKQGFPLFSTSNYFGEEGIVSSYERQDGTIGWGPDLTDMKKLQSLSKLLGEDFVGNIMGREFNLPDIQPETDETQE
jgi:hypothetical protein